MMLMWYLLINISYIAVVKIFHRWRFDASEVKLELLPPGQERREMPIVNRFNHHLMNVIWPWYAAYARFKNTRTEK